MLHSIRKYGEIASGDTRPCYKDTNKEGGKPTMNGSARKESLYTALKKVILPRGLDPVTVTEKR